VVPSWDVVAKRKKIPSLPLPEMGSGHPACSLVTMLTATLALKDNKSFKTYNIRQ